MFAREGRFFAEDLGSINGTKVNGAKIAEATELAHGDSVAVGQVVFAFVVKEAAAGAPAPQAPTEEAATQMMESMPEELFQRPPPAALPPEDDPQTRPVAPPGEPPAFDDKTSLAAPAPAYDDKTSLAEPAPTYDDDVTSGKGELPIEEESTAGKGARALPLEEESTVGKGVRALPIEEEVTAGKGGKPVGVEDVETRIGRTPAVFQDPPRALQPPVEHQETRIFEPPSAPGQNARPSRVRPAITDEAEPTPLLRRSGVKEALPAGERRSGVKGALPPGGERRSGVKNALAVGGEPRRSGVKNALAEPRKSGVKAAVPAKPQESAVDRARRRREANESLGKMLKFHWQELPNRTRYVLMGCAGAVVLGCLSAVVIALWPASAKGPTGPEPTQLSTKPIADSFGKGEGVTWARSDLKSFEFFFNTPTRAVALLHYQAKDIGPDEVTISVNGAQEGTVPPDTTNSEEREIEQVLSSRDLKRNARNVVVFDNTHNPPGEDTWRISGLWLEVIPIPELPKDQLLASAKEYAARGKQMYEQRDIGSSNLFMAWKNYRFAWLTLEALDVHPELYQLVRYQLASIGRDLDQQCGKMMLAARKAYELHDKRKARQVLDEVNAYFPTAEHRCHNLALEKANQFDL